jgi:hypothetical protein
VPERILLRAGVAVQYVNSFQLTSELVGPITIRIRTKSPSATWTARSIGIGNFGFNAGVIEYFADARRRFLKLRGER